MFFVSIWRKNLLDNHFIFITALNVWNKTNKSGLWLKLCRKIKSSFAKFEMGSNEFYAETLEPLAYERLKNFLTKFIWNKYNSQRKNMRRVRSKTGEKREQK